MYFVSLPVSDLLSLFVKNLKLAAPSSSKKSWKAWFLMSWWWFLKCFENESRVGQRIRLPYLAQLSMNCYRLTQVPDTNHHYHHHYLFSFVSWKRHASKKLHWTHLVIATKTFATTKHKSKQETTHFTLDQYVLCIFFLICSWFSWGHTY